MRPGLHDGIEDAAYHGDRESLSVSGAKVLLKAPALFRWQQDHPVHKDVFDYGSAAHKLVLGVGDPIEVIEADDWRSKAAREAKEAARKAGAIPLLAADYARVQDMADALSGHTLAMRLLSEGRPEVSGYAIDEETGVLMRGRFDWLHPVLLVDYKTALSADPRDLAGRYGAVRKWGYDMQAEWYLNLARLCDHPAEAFAFIVQQKDPPYLVSVAFVEEADLYEAHAKRRDALRIFRDCTEADSWPGYLPDYAAARLSLTDQTYIEESFA